MAIIRLFLEARVPVVPDETVPFILSSANLIQGYFPSRGLPYSILVHCLLLSLLISLRAPHFKAAQARPPLQLRTEEMVRTKTPRVVMYLPLIGDGSRASGFPERKEPARGKKPILASITSKKGLSYPGPQPILSDLPNPTNQILSILQPTLDNPSILVPPLLLPNLVQMAESRAANQPERPEPENTPPDEVKRTEPSLAEPPVPATPAERPIPRPPDVQDEWTLSRMLLPPMEMVPPTYDVPKLILPPLAPPPPEPKLPDPSPKKELPEPARLATPPEDLNLSSEKKAPEISRAPVEPPKIEPQPKESGKALKPPSAEIPPLPGSGQDRLDLLALTPMPSPIKQFLEVPAGEARGRFAISPEPSLITPETEPGSKRETTLSPAEALAEAKEASESMPSVTPAVIEVAWGAPKSGSPSTSTANSAAGGTGTGKGNSPAAGKVPFSGITIVGGSYDPGTAANPDPVVQAPKPLQTAYGMTVISTENSGGGLPFSGVFSHEQIYTVYLDMRRTEADTAPSWALEFALLNTTDPASASADMRLGTEGLILPFPAVKKQPELPAELIREHLRSLMIVYAVINTEGKMEQLSVKESPDAKLNEPMLGALSQWIFRPARLNGESVAVKVLIGIPLWLPE